MCDDCHGDGYCRRCGGDGTRAKKLLTGAEFIAAIDALPEGTFAGLVDAWEEDQREERDDEWLAAAPGHLERVRLAMCDAVDSGICAPRIDDWRTWIWDLVKTIPPMPSRGEAQKKEASDGAP